MSTENLIAVSEFCIIHNIEDSFVNSLKQTGLIELITIEEADFIDPCQLSHLEKIVRFYFEFDINLEGIESIIWLLQQIVSLQDEVKTLRNRLRVYER